MGKKISVLIAALLMITAGCTSRKPETPSAGELCEKYITSWRAMYPSRSYSRGFLQDIFRFEDLSGEKISVWTAENQRFLEMIQAMPEDIPRDDRIDLRLLKTQIESELLKWEEETPHRNSLELYASPIAQAVPRVLRASILTSQEKIRLARIRLDGVKRICAAAQDQLINGSPESTGRALQSLARAAEYYSEKMSRAIAELEGMTGEDRFRELGLEAAECIRRLIKYVEDNVVPRMSLSGSPVLGRDRFARRLILYSDSDLTPEDLEKTAYEEIQTVRSLIGELARDYLLEAYPDQRIPETYESLVEKAFHDMEMNHPSGEQEYLQLLRGFAREAEEFVRDHKIATLPDHQTLSIELAPESSGPMARIGYVQPAPAFHPNPWTTWYLATIPDTHPEKEREEFWRSFNNHFKKFIVIHELFPGHYMQSKIARENPHHVRVLFPHGLYSEGWATLCERIALEAGWDEGNKPTRLAQLRKRLENANRAYTSVKAHCSGWTEQQVLDFSVGTSLLAPQFAKSLWGRLMDSPLQITSYFLGNQRFTQVYEQEKNRRGDSFNILIFMDTILRAGPIPIDEFPALFQTGE